MTPLTEFSEKNHFLGPKVAAIDPCLIEISLCAEVSKRADHGTLLRLFPIGRVNVDAGELRHRLVGYSRRQRAAAALCGAADWRQTRHGNATL